MEHLNVKSRLSVLVGMDRKVVVWKGIFLCLAEHSTVAGPARLTQGRAGV